MAVHKRCNNHEYNPAHDSRRCGQRQCTGDGTPSTTQHTIRKGASSKSHPSAPYRWIHQGTIPRTPHASSSAGAAPWQTAPRESAARPSPAPTPSTAWSRWGHPNTAANTQCTREHEGRSNCIHNANAHGDDRVWRLPKKPANHACKSHQPQSYPWVLPTASHGSLQMRLVSSITEKTSGISHNSPTTTSVRHLTTSIHTASTAPTATTHLRVYLLARGLPTEPRPACLRLGCSGCRGSGRGCGWGSTIHRVVHARQLPQRFLAQLLDLLVTDGVANQLYNRRHDLARMGAGARAMALAAAGNGCSSGSNPPPVPAPRSPGVLCGVSVRRCLQAMFSSSVASVSSTCRGCTR